MPRFLLMATLMGDVDQVLLLLDSAQHPSVDTPLPENGLTMLHTACLMGHVALARTLLERGAGIDAADDR